MLDFVSSLIPTSKLDLFVRSVDISSYLPGRVRLYSQKLVGNSDLEQKIQAKLTSFAEIDRVTTNIATGSILIEYTPAVLRANKELKKIEAYIMSHARRK